MVHLAYEWRVLPDELERLSPRMLATMYRYLSWRQMQIQKASKEGRR